MKAAPVLRNLPCSRRCLKKASAPDLFRLADTGRLAGMCHQPFVEVLTVLWLAASNAASDYVLRPVFQAAERARAEAASLKEQHAQSSV